MTIIEHLATVPDFRRKEGRRYPLWVVLTMIIMAIMSGRYAYREIARFIQANQQDLQKYLNLGRHVCPSHVTIREILQRLDFSALNAAFARWMSEYAPLKQHDWIALDGKCLGSTITDYDNCYQAFVTMVSAFALRQGVVIRVEKYNNAHKSEIAAVQELILALGLKDVIFTIDALHCQKKL